MLDLDLKPPLFPPGPWTWPFRITDYYRLAALQSVFRELKGTVLDFGCGSKPFEPVLKHDGVTKWIGVDLQARTSGEGHTNRADVLWDGEVLPFSDGSVDIVLSTQVFEHVVELHETLAEIARVLEPGGTLVATVPMTSVLHEEPYDFRRLTPYGMASEARKVGLDLESAISLGGALSTLGTLIAGHSTMLSRVPIMGGLLQGFICFLTLDGSFLAERFLYRCGFRQHQICMDYLYVIKKAGSGGRD